MIIVRLGRKIKNRPPRSDYPNRIGLVQIGGGSFFLKEKEKEVSTRNEDEWQEIGDHMLDHMSLPEMIEWCADKLENNMFFEVLSLHYALNKLHQAHNVGVLREGEIMRSAHLVMRCESFRRFVEKLFPEIPITSPQQEEMSTTPMC